MGKNSWLLLWNSTEWDWDKKYEEICTETQNGIPYKTDWVFYGSTDVDVHIGDDVFLFKSGTKPTGIFAHGVIDGKKFKAPHHTKEKADKGEMQPHIPVMYDRILNYKTEPILDAKTIKGIIPDNHLRSGVLIEGNKEKLQKLWNAIIGEKENEGDVNLNTMDNCVSLLKNNHNLILTGAPGTGKTYLAKQIAKQMIFGENKEKLTNEERILLNERCHFVQFHPSYDYTDFVEGLRPINDKGNVGFERKDGAFKDFCKIALSYNTKIEDIEGRVVKNQSMVDEKIETIKLRILNFLEKNKSTEYEYNNGMILYRFDRQVGDDLIFSARWKNPASRLPQNIVTINMPIFIKYVLFDIYLQDELPENHKDYIENKYVWAYYENFENEIMSDDEINQLIYETRDLIESRKCVFIIDEINRGEISKIFGELFFSIDPGYRGEGGRVDTQYQNMVEDGDVFKKGFFVPENVYIIGTMNDIDRSVESMDFAMRRRFAWKEVSADDSMQMLNGMANANEMKARMTSLNNAILAIKELGKAYQIGAAYFKKYELYNDFNKLWEYHLEGVLREYLRGNPNAEEQLKELKKAYDIESATDESDDTNE